MKRMQKLIPVTVAGLAMVTLSGCSSEGGSSADSSGSSSVVVTSVPTSETTSASPVTVTETEPTSEEQLAPVQPTSGGCEPADFRAAGDELIDNIDSCDGQWATGGKRQTDYVRHFRFDDGQWMPVEPAGETFTGFSCYDAAALAEQGAPGWLLDRLVVCDTSTDSGELAMPGTQCTTYDSGPLVIKAGEISCDEAVRVMDYYRAHASEGGGNTAFLTFEDWGCATSTAGRTQETGWTSTCNRTDGVEIGLRVS